RGARPRLHKRGILPGRGAKVKRDSALARLPPLLGFGGRCMLRPASAFPSPSSRDPAAAHSPPSPRSPRSPGVTEVLATSPSVPVPAEAVAPPTDAMASPAPDAPAGAAGPDAGFVVRLESFAGPLDLLLHLIREEQLDI